MTTFTAFIRFLFCMNCYLLRVHIWQQAVPQWLHSCLLGAHPCLMMSEGVTEAISTVTVLTGFSPGRSSLVSNKPWPFVEGYFTFTESTCLSHVYLLMFHIWVLWWTVGIVFVVKASPVTACIGFPSCVNSLCLMSPDFWEQDFPHSVHTKGVFPVWNCWYAMRQAFRLKALPHSVQPNGFSPVWVHWCIIRLQFWMKSFPHSLHI